MTLTENTENTETTETTIVLTAPVNLRDLGGIPIEGGVLRDGFAIRADDLSTITDADATRLIARGLRSVIDLRSIDEVRYTGRGVLAEHPVAYHHLPLMSDIGSSMNGDEGFAPTPEWMGRMYVRLVERAAPQLASALAIIALSPGATAFHCAAGADRTGVLAASFLLALGASEADVITDYSRTGANMTAIHERLRPVMGALMSRVGIDMEELASTAGAGFSEASMRTMLTTLTETYGDPLAPLREAGLSDAIVERLRERALLELA